MGVHTVNLIPIIPISPLTRVPVDIQGLVPIPQCQSNWCWAACTLMVLTRYNMRNGLKECDLANSLFKQANCCGDGGSLNCNKGCGPDDVLVVYNQYKIKGNIGLLQLDISAARQESMSQLLLPEIMAQRPVEICYQLNDRGSHVVIVAGYTQDDTGQFLFKIFDPLGGTSCLPIGRLAILDGKGKWTLNWTEIQPQ